MCSIVAHENEFQLLFQKFAFATDIAIPIYNGIRWISSCDVMFSKHSLTYTIIWLHDDHEAHVLIPRGSTYITTRC